tara:strand:+ start:92 stop:277 length:186 start_codon:yes stop_codon:yes gene_type:complete
MNKMYIKKEIKKLENIESQLLVMLATRTLNEDELKRLISEIFKSIQYRSRFLKILKEMEDK